MMSDVPEYHINTQQVAALAKQAGVGELVLTHIIPPVPNDTARENDFMAGMSDVYGGSIRMARDTQRISVGKRA
jgi:ribonuclease Z